MQGIERTFDQLDTNNDGVITRDEWAQANAIGNANATLDQISAKTQALATMVEAEVSRGVN